MYVEHYSSGYEHKFVTMKNKILITLTISAYIGYRLCRYINYDYKLRTWAQMFFCKHDRKECLTWIRLMRHQ